MKRLLLPLLALIFVPDLRADDTTIAQHLETLGGKIVSSAGVVTQVTFTDCSMLGDPEFEAIGHLPALKSLTLYGGKQTLNDSTVSHLLGLKTLESLASEGARLSDEGLARLAALTNLRSASFFHLSYQMEGFSGKGFAAWSVLPHLQKLTVAGMSMGDEGFAAIAEITSLRDLATWHTYQTEAGNREIAKLPLTSLKIGQRLPHQGAAPSFTDASLSTIAGIQTLETLILTEGRLTLPALRELKKLPALKHLQIAESDVAESELDALRQELPAVKIDFQLLTDEQRKKLDAYLK